MPLDLEMDRHLQLPAFERPMEKCNDNGRVTGLRMMTLQVAISTQELSQRTEGQDNALY